MMTNRGKWTHKLTDLDGYWWMAYTSKGEIYFSPLYNPAGNAVEPEDSANMLDGKTSVEDFYADHQDVVIKQIKSFKGNK